MADETTRRIDRLESKLKKLERRVDAEERERKAFGKNLRIFLQRLRSQLGFRF